MNNNLEDDFEYNNDENFNAILEEEINVEFFEDEQHQVKSYI